MKIPNLFIIGSPKCGTTSLANWLNNHPQIFMSKRKEPEYFCDDLIITKYRINKSSYMKLFASSNNQHIWRGEASTHYMFSKVACKKILEISKSPKFIAIIRNPVELVYSLYNQRIFDGLEHIETFEEAWSLNNERENNNFLIKDYITGDLLNYGKMGLLGEQLKRFFSLVPEPDRLVLIFDDLKENPRLVFERIIDFLNIEKYKMDSFPIYNKSSVVRSQIYRSIFHNLIDLKGLLGIKKTIGIGNFLSQINTKVKSPEPLSVNTIHMLKQFFKNDINNIENLLNRDLSHWK